MNSRNAEAISEIFNRYDTERTGVITKDQLKNCIYDLNGRSLDDAELNNIIELMDGDHDGKIKLEDFVKTMEQFFKYC